MLKLKIISFCFVLLMVSCSCQDSNEKVNHQIVFSDLVHLEKLTSVEMRNNSGTFNLTDAQIKKLKTELNQMIYAPHMSAKVGAIQIKLKINNQDFYISTATHGKYMEIPRDLIHQNLDAIDHKQWLYFKTNGVNFDNYQNQNK